MIRTYECKRAGKRWNDVIVLDTETNDFITFCYEIVSGKLVKFSEHTCKNGAQLWNPGTDLKEEIIREYQLYRYGPITAAKV